MVRATNTGISAVIDPTGKIATQTPLFEQGVVVHQVPILIANTCYSQIGDWLILAYWLLLVWPLSRRRTLRGKPF